jgi:hypothetical protein
MEATVQNHSLFGAAACALLLVSLSTAANAQATRTWVSGVGDDANPCSRTAPCKTFAGAISKTAVNGEINCLDPGGYGAVTVTKSITLNCFYTNGSILNASTSGVIVNITAATDALKTVRLVGININGSGSGTRAGIHGVNILAATQVFIENVLITDQTQVGIRDTRAVANGKLSIVNSVSRNNGVAGIQIIPSAAVNVNLDNVQSLGNGQGFAIGNQVKAIATRSNFSHNGSHGVAADPGGIMTVNSSVMAFNQNGVQPVAGSTVRLSDNDIAFNATGVNGATNSFGTNRIHGNTAAGTTPTLSGAATEAFSQQ